VTSELLAARDNAVVLTTRQDEVFVLGGANNRTAEVRAWSEELGDYVFRPLPVEGLDLLESPDCYEAALPNVVVDGGDEEHMPSIPLGTKFLFGNEVDSYFVEFPESMIPSFFWCSMHLQLKTGQAAIRYDPTTVYLVGGTDAKKTKLSAKCFRFQVASKKTEEIAKLFESRFAVRVVKVDRFLFAIGGRRLDSQPASAAVEMLDPAAEASQWVQMPPLHSGRFGHVCWASGNRIFVMGGVAKAGSRPDDSVEVFSLETRAWSKSSSLA
jgi:hypothetical protein